MKKICFFGIYDRDYPRNKVLIEGFIKNGFEIEHCHVNPRMNKGLKKYWLLAKEKSTLKEKNFEFVIVAFPGHTCVWLARILFPKTPIVFDVFLSQYEANVSDRKVHKALSMSGIKDYFLDWHSIRLANIVTMDTNQHIKLFQERYGLSAKKSMRIFLSSALAPRVEYRSTNNNPFIVHFHGSFIPLHGTEYIIKAAKILEKENGIIFKLIGGGQELSKMKELAASLNLKNIEFFGRIPIYDDVLKMLDEADVMLGVFGISDRTKWMIPNKIFEGMAFGKAMISADTAATRELFTDREDILFCNAADADNLAKAILELKGDEHLREKIGRKSLGLFKEKLSPEKLVSNFLIELHKKHDIFRP